MLESDQCVSVSLIDGTHYTKTDFPQVLLTGRSFTAYMVGLVLVGVGWAFSYIAASSLVAGGVLAARLLFL